MEETHWQGLMRRKVEDVEERAAAGARIMLTLIEHHGVKVDERDRRVVLGLESRKSISTESTALQRNGKHSNGINGGSEDDAKTDDDSASSRVFLKMTFATFFLRVVLVIMSAVIALSVPNFAFCLSLMGSVTTMLVSLILPAVLYVHALGPQAGARIKIFSAFIVFVGFYGMYEGLKGTRWKVNADARRRVDAPFVQGLFEGGARHLFLCGLRRVQ